ncbi:RNA ligase [Cytophagaceae bacterium DM2B3-1]|uniref:RNA ligase n=1 Tax=Xanthocytophaga flava TaxID=3048013 RepID=A0ABT7CNU5_9BACT|nr:RNA ligase [Xanthocytophaga flavus]MDJ1494675.1 RNA ligase [Xanthocytophaga flavus]
MELQVQTFLRSKSLNDLTTQYGIRANRHKQYPHLVQLKYDQLESSMREPVVQECRGIILDESNNWEIVSFPFKKFFNYDEFYASTIDWTQARVYEKIDGSIMTLYFYNGAWHIASASLPDASGQIRDQTFTMSELFWNTWKSKGYELPTDTDWCYVFELTSPYTQIVVPYTENNLTLIGARNTKTLQEEFPEIITAKYKWDAVPSFPLTKLEEVLEAGKQLNPMKQEGFVVCDANFNRVKIKSLQYVSIGFLRGIEDKTTHRYLLEIIKTNEGSEFLSYMKEYTEPYQKLKLKYDALISELETHWNQIKDIEDRKTFGISASSTKIPGVFFQLRDQKVHSVKTYLYEMKTQALLDILNKM